MPPGAGYRWVYLWHWPIRAMHWAAAGAVVVLIVTGFYIGKPYFMVSGGVSGTPYLMGWVRFLHFVAAGVFVATAIVRIYWLFVGNRFERWRALFPVTGRDWVNLGKIVRSYLFIRTAERPEYLGHNPLQQISYTLIYAVSVVMVVTGFAIYGQANPGGFFHTLFGWAPALFGGIQSTRLIHHVLAWVFVIFVPIHVYLAVRVDVLERTGTLSSMISGGRFRPSGVHYEDDMPGEE
jgi:Ni/Fe-hydrogenase b-type cytochrome subunit